MSPLHLGSLHPFEQALTLLLAFGPFVLLGVVLVVRHRQDRVAAEDQRERAGRGSDHRVAPGHTSREVHCSFLPKLPAS